MMANARSATELQVLLRSDDDDRAPLSSSELQLLRASAGDWCATLFLVGLGFYLDKFVPPFERSVVPQLHDPDISYPHTPSNSAHVPVLHLYLFAFAVPLVAVVALSARAAAPTRSPRRCSGCSRAWRSRSSRCASSRAPSAGCAPTSSRAASRRPTAAAQATRTSSWRAANPSRRGTRRSRSPGSATSRSSSPRACCRAAARVDGAAVEALRRGDAVDHRAAHRPQPHRRLLAPLVRRRRRRVHRQPRGVLCLPAEVPAAVGRRRDAARRAQTPPLSSKHLRGKRSPVLITRNV